MVPIRFPALVVSVAAALSAPLLANGAGRNGLLTFTRYGNHGDSEGVYVANADTSRVRRIRPDAVPFPVAWSSDRSKIAYGGMAGLFVAKPDGTERRLVVRGAWAGALPAWSPDGHTIAFALLAGGVRLVRTDGTGLRWVPGTRRYTAGEIAWSPDGKWLAYTDTRADALHVVQLDSGLTRLLVPRDAAGVDWSPDGRTIFFTRQLQAVYRIGLTGKPTLVFRPQNDRLWSAAFSSDGTRLAYLSIRTGDLHIVSRRDGQNTTIKLHPNLCIRGYTCLDLAWQPPAFRG
jgi:Tol biopolymer transport system component